MGDEWVDVVDEHDRVIRSVIRAEMRRKRLRHRAVFVAVTDGDGRLLLHRRAPTKDIWPGWFDIAVGGVVASGESYHQAAERELAEEVGVSGVDLVSLDGGVARAFDDAEVSLMGRCYLVTTPGPFRFRDGEVSEAWWATRAEFERLRSGETSQIAGRYSPRERFLPDSLALLLPLLDNW